MKYKKLGKSELEVSQVSFGCMSLEGDHTENAALLHKALDKGINLFDTADLYQQGENEKTVGKAFNGMRDKVVLATKVGNQMRPDGSGWDWNPTKAYILQAVEESLKRLQTDYIDLYQLHGGTIEDPIDETIEAFELLKQQGKIRAYGISSIRPNVIREYVKRSHIVSVMMQYSLLDRRPEESCLGLLQENNIGVLARGSYAQGLLVNKPVKAYLTLSEEEVKKAADAVKRVAGNSRSAAEVAARYVIDNPAITSAVLGIRTNEQLQDALQASEASPLNKEEKQALQQAVPPIKYEQHR
ncbi:aldo/keto reductase [Pontibacter diazotrophicus]|uniref:Aldo/keto reductase n=1 Tax=Pontibacter diazotrophicus TaxID=1400979 RepID=A0A3D8LHR9_9BACT|nr:aldo/keto reductase [Pontibacter diazotrophicus]RDV16937.1 aldo/keto reductase [Pontibacter diazotrophicus]